MTWLRTCCLLQIWWESQHIQIKPNKLQAKIGLDSGQVVVLKKCFDAFSTEEGTINCDTIGSILSMMGMKVGSRQFIPSWILKLILSSNQNVFQYSYNKLQMLKSLLKSVLWTVKRRTGSLRRVSGAVPAGHICQENKKLLTSHIVYHIGRLNCLMSAGLNVLSHI